MQTTLSTRLNHVRQRIDDACRRAGRCADSVTLVAVSKKKPLDMITALAGAGIRHFGESYLQEAEPKIAAAPDLCWHFIGQIQRRKCKTIAGLFQWVQSIDRAEVAMKLNEHRLSDQPPLNVLIQINPDGEQGKGGVAPEDAQDLARQIQPLPRLRLRGLMSIPAPSPDMDRRRQSFAVVRQVYDDLKHHGFNMDTLSLGMSGDLDLAIEEGATMVRVGTALFGQRD